jgi:hypothetical protein
MVIRSTVGEARRGHLTWRAERDISATTRWHHGRMDPKITAELAAMQTVYDTLVTLDPDGRCRAVLWLAARFGVDLSDYDLTTAREALAAAQR